MNQYRLCCISVYESVDNGHPYNIFKEICKKQNINIVSCISDSFSESWWFLTDKPLMHIPAFLKEIREKVWEDNVWGYRSD